MKEIEELKELVKRFELYFNVIKDFVKYDEDWLEVVKAAKNKSMDDLSSSVGLTYVTEYNLFRKKIEPIRNKIFRIYHTGEISKEKEFIYSGYRKLVDEYLEILDVVPNIQINWG